MLIEVKLSLGALVWSLDVDQRFACLPNYEACPRLGGDVQLQERLGVAQMACWVVCHQLLFVLFVDLPQLPERGAKLYAGDGCSSHSALYTHDLLQYDLACMLAMVCQASRAACTGIYLNFKLAGVSCQRHRFPFEFLPT